MEFYDFLSNGSYDPDEVRAQNEDLKKILESAGSKMSSSDDLDPLLENQFLKNIMAVENGVPKPIANILGIDPADFPPPEKLSSAEIEEKFEQLLAAMSRKNFVYELAPGLPTVDAYRYLSQEFLLEDDIELPGNYYTHVDGCDGHCPDCFQGEYCQIREDVWPGLGPAPEKG